MVSVTRAAPSAIDCGFDLWSGQSVLVVSVVLIMVFNATFNNISVISWQFVWCVQMPDGLNILPG
jgi:hypothetical protein